MINLKVLSTAAIVALALPLVTPEPSFAQAPPGARAGGGGRPAGGGGGGIEAVLPLGVGVVVTIGEKGKRNLEPVTKPSEDSLPNQCP